MPDNIMYIYDVPEKINPGKEIWTDRKGKDFEESYCDACEVDSIKCPVCGLGSCSGGACDYCRRAFQEYNNGS